MFNVCVWVGRRKQPGIEDERPHPKHKHKADDFASQRPALEMNWDLSHVVTETLEFYGNNGDVQT